MFGHPDPFRSVRDLGPVPPGCPRGSGASRGCSSVWLPAWLPRPNRRRGWPAAWKVGLRSGSACLSAGQPLYRVVREW